MGLAFGNQHSIKRCRSFNGGVCKKLHSAAGRRDFEGGPLGRADVGTSNADMSSTSESCLFTHPVFEKTDGHSTFISGVSDGRRESQDNRVSVPAPTIKGSLHLTDCVIEWSPVDLRMGCIGFGLVAIGVAV
jgi:hypothetical protein